jgi:hypothetical protein
MSRTLIDEYIRVSRMLNRLTLSVPIMLMAQEQIESVANEAAKDSQLAKLERELRSKLKAVKGPEDHKQMAQAYEAYSEASFYLAMKNRGVALERTPATGGNKEKRPDFLHRSPTGDIYFEIKALDIVEPLSRHMEIGLDALENAAELDARARSPGAHLSLPLEISGHLPSANSADCIDDCAQTAPFWPLRAWRLMGRSHVVP